ncbi:MAG: urease accessory protein UreE [Pseudomonadota bacterium]
MLTAQIYRDHSHRASIGRVDLTYEDRFLRRKVLALASGAQLLVDLPATTSLDEGGVLVTTTGSEVTVHAAPEPLLEVTGDALHRIAWHIGNRHTPCQIEETRLLIQRDHVMVDMLARIGATTREVVAPFSPEGGAYGHGRTHGHDHSHVHDPAPHANVHEGDLDGD